MIQIERLSKRFDEHIVFDAADLKISTPGFYLLTGKNGSGKTTLFKILKKILPYDQGKIVLADEVSIVRANPLLLDSLTLMENLLLFHSDEQELLQLLKRLKITADPNTKARKLSGGERQKVAVIQAVLENKKIVLFDEITAHLDDQSTLELLSYLKDASVNRLFIVSSHLLHDFKDIFNGVLSIKKKKIIFTPTSPLKQDKKIEPDCYRPDKKILYKAFGWSLKNWLMIWVGIISALLLFFIQMSLLDEETLYYREVNQTEGYSYLVKKLSENFVYQDNHFPLGEVPSITEEQKEQIGDAIFVVQTNNFISPFDFFQEHFYAHTDRLFSPRIDQFFLINEWENRPLSDHEIVISDYLYETFRRCGLVDFHNEIKLFGTDFYIRHIYDTNYIELRQYDEPIVVNEQTGETKPEYFFMDAFIHAYNYVYYNCYLSESAFKCLEDSYFNWLEEKGIVRENDTVSIRCATKDLNIEGNLPQKRGEVLFSRGYVETLDHEIVLQQPIELKEDGGFFSFKRWYQQRTYHLDVIVSGIVETDEVAVYFYDEEDRNRFLQSGYRKQINYAFLNETLSKEDIALFYQEEIWLANQNDHYKRTMEIASNMKPRISFLASIFAIVVFLFYAVIGILFVLRRRRTCGILLEKNINSIDLKKTMLKDGLQTGVLLSLSFVLSFTLLIEIPYVTQLFQRLYKTTVVYGIWDGWMTISILFLFILYVFLINLCSWIFKKKDFE